MTTRTVAMEMTIRRLTDHEESRGGCPVSVSVTPYGDCGAVLVIVTDDSGLPFPNPCVAIWQDGSAHEVTCDADFMAWMELLAGRPRAIQRVEDACYVVFPSGVYCRLEDRDEIARILSAMADDRRATYAPIRDAFRIVSDAAREMDWSFRDIGADHARDPLAPLARDVTFAIDHIIGRPRPERAAFEIANPDARTRRAERQRIYGVLPNEDDIRHIH